MTNPSAAAARPDAAPARVELAAVVASLVRPTTHEVLTESRSSSDGSLLLDREHVTVRPLLAELRASIVPGGESGGSGRGGGVPLDVGVADVIRDLERLVRVALRLLRLRPRPVAGECESCGTPLARCRRGLDQLGRDRIGPWLAPCCARHRHPEPRDPIADALAQLAPARWPTPAPAALTREAFTERLAELAERGRALLAGETSGTYVRDTRCPVCLAEWVTEAVPGGHDRHPALRVNRAPTEPDGTPGPVRGTSCTRCQRRWSWDEMQGPAPGQPAGKLWELLTADRAVVMAGARVRAKDARAAELLRRAARYNAGDQAAALGLPRTAPAPRIRPADRPMPPVAELPVRDDTETIRAAMTRARRTESA